MFAEKVSSSASQVYGVYDSAFVVMRAFARGSDWNLKDARYASGNQQA